MPFNPNDARQMKRLGEAVRQSRYRLEPFRANRVRAIREMVGRWYSDDASPWTVPINLMAKAVGVYSRQLAANNPQALVTTSFPQLRAAAAEWEIALNQLIDEINLRDTLLRCVVDAILEMGIVKIGLSGEVSDEDVHGFLHDAGQPYCDVVDLDDWVHDMTAKQWESIEFAGNLYRLPYDYVRDNPMFSRKARDKLQKSDEDIYRGEYGTETAKSLGTGEDRGGQLDTLVDHVDLLDLWLPRPRLVLTMAWNDGELGDPPLRIVEWDGPEAGPYHLLTYSPVPSNTMPLAPAGIWRDLHDAVNQMVRKTIRQAGRQKNVTLVRAGSEADGKRVVDANDGDMITTDDPKNVNEVRFGGPDNNLMAAWMALKSEFDWMAGNLSALGGLGPQAPTATQDKLLKASASEELGEYQDRTTAFSKKVVRDLAWYLWTDPFPRQIQKQVMGIPIPGIFDPTREEGDFIDYNLQIEPYSMMHQSPQQRLSTVMSTVGQLVLPLLPMLQEQGIGVDLEQLLRTIAKYSNTPELDGILSYTSGRFDKAPYQPRQAPQTTRTQIRENRSSQTQPGQNEVVKQLLQGQRQERVA